LTRQQYQEILDAPNDSAVDPPSSPPISRTFEDLLSHLSDQDIHFSPETVSNYLLALQARRFVILSGISGTGKTRLALAVARFFQPTASPAENHVVAAVRPDWTDHRGLLGYFNPLTGRYISTPFLDLLLRAREEAEAARLEDRMPAPFFAILDEMNLARVEHYFSDFLSALESGEPLQLHQELNGETGEANPVPRSLKVPDNLFFTGTVNVDESTYMFSPKILDRAFTLELNEVDLEGLSKSRSPQSKNPGVRLDRFSGPLAFESTSASVSWDRFSHLLNGELRRTVMELNDLLAIENRHFGYRVAGEIARFVQLAADQSSGDEKVLLSALDLALLQKVLPKFHGTQQELEEVLNDLFRFAVLGRRRTTEDRDPVLIEWAVSEGALHGDPIPVLPRFALKVWRMRRRLERQGFTSFIE
jgi:5-methylcytosine-specific restriction enzyme B